MANCVCGASNLGMTRAPMVVDGEWFCDDCLPKKKGVRCHKCGKSALTRHHSGCNADFIL